VVELPGLLIFHDACNVVHKGVIVSGAAQKIETHFHSGRDSTGGDDAPAIDDARSADPARWRELRKPINWRHTGAGTLDENGKAGLGLHWPRAIRHEKRLQLWVEPAGCGEDAMRRREIYDFGIFENINAETKAWNLCVHLFQRCKYACGVTSLTLPSERGCPHPRTNIRLLTNGITRMWASAWRR